MQPEGQAHEELKERQAKENTRRGLPKTKTILQWSAT
jgi:hypothetical protein